MPVRRALLVTLLAAAALTSGCGGAYREFPRWRFTAPPTVDAGCALGRAFVRTSGKTGVGLSVEVRSRGDCVVRFTRAELVLDGLRVPGQLPAALTLRGRSLVHVWIPFAFDNNQAWNDGRRTGTFEFDLDTAGTATSWRITADHRREHRYRPGSDPWAR